MPKKLDMIGRTFGRLVVLRELPSPAPNHEKRYECRCACGGLVEARGSSLRRGQVTSCGCRRRDRFADRRVLYDGSPDSLRNFMVMLVEDFGWAFAEAFPEPDPAAPRGVMRLRYMSRRCEATHRVPPWTVLRVSDDGEEILQTPAGSPRWFHYVVDRKGRRDFDESGIPFGAEKEEKDGE